MKQYAQYRRQDLVDDLRVLDTGHHPQLGAARGAGLDVDVKDPRLANSQSAMKIMHLTDLPDRAFAA